MQSMDILIVIFLIHYLALTNLRARSGVIQNDAMHFYGYEKTALSQIFGAAFSI